MRAGEQRQHEEQVLDFSFHGFIFWEIVSSRIQRPVQGQIKFASHAGIGRVGGLSVEECRHRHGGESQRGEPTVYVLHNFIPASVVFVYCNQILFKQINAEARRTQRNGQKF